LRPGLPKVLVSREENGLNFGNKVGERCCKKIEKVVQNVKGILTKKVKVNFRTKLANWKSD